MPHFTGFKFFQDGACKAFRAASTAKSTSWGPASATLAMTNSSKGLTVSNVSPDFAATN
ncbi:hypothetical protein GQ53DRAFT_852155 [Thozetella sp. PMI_491]|nr:hypothetical protein GQ53DRAFT_852155 [Thozetella sp. PMI_491]